MRVTPTATQTRVPTGTGDHGARPRIGRTSASGVAAPRHPRPVAAREIQLDQTLGGGGGGAKVASALPDVRRDLHQAGRPRAPRPPSRRAPNCRGAAWMAT